MSIQHSATRFSLKSLKNQARQLLKAQQGGEYEAWGRIKALHPRLSRSLRWSDTADFAAVDFSLQDAQLVIAREYGFSSWPRLVAAVAPREEAPDPEPGGAETDGSTRSDSSSSVT